MLTVVALVLTVVQGHIHYTGSQYKFHLGGKDELEHTGAWLNLEDDGTGVYYNGNGETQALHVKRFFDSAMMWYGEITNQAPASFHCSMGNSQDVLCSWSDCSAGQSFFFRGSNQNQNNTVAIK